MSVREPAVAGMFYHAEASALQKQVETCFTGAGGPGSLPEVDLMGPRKVLGLVSPHAGLMYSGPVAAWSYHRLAEDGLPDTAVLIGPNHRSYLPPVALSDERAWLTPFGEAELDSVVTAEIAARYPDARVEPAVHHGEHSLEVQLPFLQYLARISGSQIRIVPILIGAAAQMAAIGTLANAIAGALQGRNAIVIASTDFSHYEPGETAARKDSQAISAIEGLDEEALLQTVRSLDVSMCGVLPTAVMIAACKKLGANSARLLTYRNSGDVTGDYTEVVGYAAVEVCK